MRINYWTQLNDLENISVGDYISDEYQTYGKVIRIEKELIKKRIIFIFLNTGKDFTVLRWVVRIDMLILSFRIYQTQIEFYHFGFQDTFQVSMYLYLLKNLKHILLKLVTSL